MSIFWGLGFALNVITYGLHMSLRKGWGTNGGGGILNLSLLANGGCGLVMLGLCALSAGDMKLHNNTFWF